MSDQEPELPVILVVDDSKVIRRAAIKMLGDGYDVLQAEDGQDAWGQIQENTAISVIFTDLSMPNMGGMELLENIRASDDEHINALPVIIMTGHGDTEKAKQQVFEKGATDFISKPFESIDLLTRAKSYAKLSRKVVELEKKTGFDKLTGLYNISSFEDSGNKATSFSVRHKLQMTTAYFEIDNFQQIYLSHGKSVAQQILLAVSQRLKTSLRAEDVAARTAVAKFAAILPMTGSVKSMVVINRIRETINKLVFDTGNEKIRVSLSVGYSSLSHDNPATFDILMEQADDALVRATVKDSQDKVVAFVEEKKEAQIIDEAELSEVIMNILDGEFYHIEERHHSILVDRLQAYIDYVNSQFKEKSQAN